MASLESCDVVNSPCKDFFFWLFDSSMKCWAEMFFTNVVWVLMVCYSPSTKFWSVKYPPLICDPLVIFPEEFLPNNRHLLL